MNDQLLVNILVLLCISIVFISLFKRLHFPPTIAYFFVGIIIGNQLIELEAFNLQLRLIGEIGIVFLMFTIGLEFSLSRLTSMYKSVFLQGGLQVLLCVIVFTLLAKLYAVTWPQAILIGSAISLSSTAIVLQLINEENAIQTHAGITSTAILLFQDLAVIPLLIIIPALSHTHGGVVVEIFKALLIGLSALFVFLTLGKKLLPKFLHFIAHYRSEELFVLSTLFIALATAWITHSLGLSMVLGAFLAGITLGESQYRYQISADIRPFRDILMGLFFISIGMMLDAAILIDHFFEILTILLIILTVKASAIYLALRTTGESSEDAIQTAFMIPQMGEFSFVVIALLLQHNLVGETLGAIFTTAGILSMIITPSLIRHRKAIANRLLPSTDSSRPPVEDDVIQHATGQSSHHVIICGYGRVGQTLGRFLTQVNIPFIAIDSDPLRVQEARAAQESVFYGDACHIEAIKAAKIFHATMVIISFDNVKSASTIIKNIHAIKPTANILARTQNEAHMEQLLQAGASEVLPESFEASLMLCGHCLASLNVPLIQIINLIQRIREDNYSMLKGFYHGEITDISMTMMNKHKKIHAVKLTESAFAKGKSLRRLDAHLSKIDIRSVRYSGHIEQPPDKDRLLQAEDILILIGDPADIDAVESFLFSGL